MINPMLPEAHRILGVTHETKAEYTFRVACDTKTKHGQFFQLSIPKAGEAPISVSGKGEGYLEFTIRKVGRLTEGIFMLRPGDMLFMRGPYGNAFPLDKFDGKHLVVIAGGTGLAPVRSLLNEYYCNPERVPSLYLISGCKDADSMLFVSDLEKFKDRFHTCYTLDKPEKGFESGLVTEHICKVPFSSFDDYNVVIVGPPAMMNYAGKECIAQGAEESKIWMSLEQKMSCAIGKCGHCKINGTYICLEGPIFNYTIAKDLID